MNHSQRLPRLSFRDIFKDDESEMYIKNRRRFSGTQNLQINSSRSGIENDPYIDQNYRLQCEINILREQIIQDQAQLKYLEENQKALDNENDPFYKEEMMDNLAYSKGKLFRTNADLKRIQREFDLEVERTLVIEVKNLKEKLNELIADINQFDSRTSWIHNQLQSQEFEDHQQIALNNQQKIINYRRQLRITQNESKRLQKTINKIQQTKPYDQNEELQQLEDEYYLLQNEHEQKSLQLEFLEYDKQ